MHVAHFSLALATRFCCFYASVSTMKGIIVCVALQTKRCVDDEFSDVDDDDDEFSDVGDQDDDEESFYESHYGSHMVVRSESRDPRCVPQHYEGQTGRIFCPIGTNWAHLLSHLSWEVPTDSLASLSEQQLIEYSKPNSGCNGGLMDYAFTLHNAKAIASELASILAGQRRSPAGVTWLADGLRWTST